MRTKLRIEYLWIPRSLGGKRTEPYLGMRATIRWQRYVREHLERSRDIEWLQFSFDSANMTGNATLRMAADDPLPEEWLRSDCLIELLDGYKVFAIGRIIDAQTFKDEISP